MGKKIVTFVSRVTTAFNAFDIRGRAMVGLFTLVMVILCIYVTLTGKDIPGGVLTAYGTVIAGITVNRTFERTTKTPAPKADM